MESGEENPDQPGDVSAVQNDVPDDQGDAGDHPNDSATTNFKKLMARRKPAGDLQQGDQGETPARPCLYKVTVVTPAKSDLGTFSGLLPSPITDFKAHSVSAHVGLPDIDKTLAAVGTALTTTQPKKVRIVVEL
jgi:hypothetical protein